MEEFNDTYLLLAKMDSREELVYWAQSKGHNTLLFSTDTLIEAYSDALKTIFNEDSEYELGDKIIWLNKGILYEFPKKNENEIKALKSNLNKSYIVGKVSINNSRSSALKSTVLPINNIDARHQKEFTQYYYQPCGGSLSQISGLRKYVHEIYDISYVYGPTAYSYLHLRIKLEFYKTSRPRSWKPAGEQREIDINVSGTAYMYPGGSGGSFSKVESYDCSGDIDLLIDSMYGGYPYTPYWVVSMSGQIYQHVKGDLSTNAWYNAGTLW